MEENTKEKMNEEEYQKETQNILSISNKKTDVLFDKKLIEVFCKAANEFGFEKTWDMFIGLQNYLNNIIYKKTYPEEGLQAKFQKVVDLINKEFCKHGYSKKDLFKSLKRLQIKLIEEYDKLNSEKLKDCIEKNK